MKNIKKIENIFSDNVNSPIFSQLADLYFANRQYDYAYRVCQLGLANTPDDNQGKYILAKVYLVNSKLEKAEKLLQEIILSSPYSLSAFLLLMPVMKELKRSDSNIASYIKKIATFYHEHHSIQVYYKAYCNVANTKNKTIKKKNNASKNREKSLLIHQKLATRTMYKLFLKQKKYDDAYEILKAMKQNKKNIKFVKEEMPKILKKIQNN